MKEKLPNDLLIATDKYHSKLSSLASIGRTSTQPAQELDEILSKMGWHHIVSGKYSAVFESKRNKNFVLKINFQEDLGYDSYVDIIKDYQSIHFPVITDKHRLALNGMSYGVYLIEKLREIDYAEDADGLSWKYLLKQVMYNPNKSMEDLFDYMPDLYKQNPGLFEAAQYIGEHRKNYYLDIHEGNIMTRKDGTLVITDPYAIKEVTD